MKKFIILSLCLLTVLSCAIALFSNSIQNFEDTATTTSSNEKDVYATISLSSADEKIKIGDTGELYDFSDIVVVGTVASKEDATMSDKSAMPYTPGTFKVQKVIKGNVPTDVINIAMAGGTCTVEEFISASGDFPERVQKMGLNKLSESEKKTKYIEYIFPRQKDFEVGKEYVLMLHVSENDSTYYVLSDAGFLDLNVTNNASKSNVTLGIDDINSKEDILNMPNAKFE